MVGIRNPTPVPTAWVIVQAVMAMILSFGGNHTAATLAGELDKNGWPIPQISYPIIQIQNPLLMPVLITIPRAVRVIPVRTLLLHPLVSIR